MSRDVKLNIGARNQAARVLKGLEGNFKGVRTSISRTSAAVKGLQASFAPLLAVFAALKAVQGVTSLISDSTEAYLTQERAARSATDAQKAYAAGLQSQIGVGDEVSLQLMRQAEMLGINKDQADEAALAAIGLAKATGQSQTEALRKINQAMQGNANAMGELIPGIAQMETEQEKMAAVNELVNRGLQEQARSYSGLEGAQTRASNSIGDLLEVVGQILAPTRALISQGLAVLAESLQTMLAPAAEAAQAAIAALPDTLARAEAFVRVVIESVSAVFGDLVASVVPSMNTVQSVVDAAIQGIVGAITFAEVILTNFPQVVDYLASSVELQLVRIGEEFKHVFTSVIPQYVAWFGENFFNLMQDALNAARTVIENRVKQFADILLSLWDFVKSGFEGGATGLFSRVGEIANRNLLEGFEAKTQELPDMIVRSISTREQQLEQRIGSIAQNLGTQFSDKFTERMERINGAVAKQAEDLQANLQPGAVDETGKNQLAGQASNLQATQGRLLTRGRQDDPVSQVADNTKKTNEKLNDLIAATKANKPPQPQQASSIKHEFVA